MHGGAAWKLSGPHAPATSRKWNHGSRLKPCRLPNANSHPLPYIVRQLLNFGDFMKLGRRQRFSVSRRDFVIQFFGEFEQLIGVRNNLFLAFDIESAQTPLLRDWVQLTGIDGAESLMRRRVWMGRILDAAGGLIGRYTLDEDIGSWS